MSFSAPVWWLWRTRFAVCDSLSCSVVSAEDVSPVLYVRLSCHMFPGLWWCHNASFTQTCQLFTFVISSVFQSMSRHTFRHHQESIFTEMRRRMWVELVVQVGFCMESPWMVVGRTTGATLKLIKDGLTDTLTLFAVTPCIALTVSHCHLGVNLARLLLCWNFW